MRSLSVQPRYSEAQKAAIEAFRGHFDTTQKLFNVFAPSNWGYMISHLDECLKSACVTLSQVDAVYCDGVAKQIVRNQIAGVYSLCTARDQYNSSGIDMAADIFIAKYGHECTLYAMMVYFGNYMTEMESMLTGLVSAYPWTIAIAFFLVSVLINSQGAVVVAMLPLAYSLGIEGWVLLGVLPSVYGYFFIPNYPSDIATVNFDRSGTTVIGKYLLNHSFMMPGLICVIVSTIIAYGLTYLLHTTMGLY